MSFKTFTCDICGIQVTKPKSYALSNGNRACRFHQEAQDSFIASNEARRQEEKDIQHQLNTRQPRQPTRTMGCHCLHCKINGVDKGALSALRLDCMALAESLGEKQISLDPNDFVNRVFSLSVKDRYGPANLVIVTRFSIGGVEDWKIKQLVGSDSFTHSLVKSTGVVALCEKCADEFGFKPNIPSIEQITAMSLIAEQLMVEKVNFFKSLN